MGSVLEQLHDEELVAARERRTKRKVWVARRVAHHALELRSVSGDGKLGAGTSGETQQDAAAASAAGSAAAAASACRRRRRCVPVDHALLRASLEVAVDGNGFVALTKATSRDAPLPLPLAASAAAAAAGDGTSAAAAAAAFEFSVLSANIWNYNHWEARGVGCVGAGVDGAAAAAVRCDSSISALGRELVRLQPDIIGFQVTMRAHARTPTKKGTRQRRRRRNV